MRIGGFRYRRIAQGVISMAIHKTSWKKYTCKDLPYLQRPMNCLWLEEYPFKIITTFVGINMIYQDQFTCSMTFIPILADGLNKPYLFVFGQVIYSPIAVRD